MARMQERLQEVAALLQGLQAHVRNSGIVTLAECAEKVNGIIDELRGGHAGNGTSRANGNGNGSRSAQANDETNVHPAPAVSLPPGLFPTAPHAASAPPSAGADEFPTLATSKKLAERDHRHANAPSSGTDSRTGAPHRAAQAQAPQQQQEAQGTWACRPEAVAQPTAATGGPWPKPLGRNFAGKEHAPLNEADLRARSRVRRKADFDCVKRVDGRQVNIMEGLELHEGVLDAREQQELLDFVDEQVARGYNGELPGQTFNAPNKMRGKGRVTVQYGCCYSYAQPASITDDVVQEMPPRLEWLIDRMIRWGVLPAEVRPDSAIINVYSEGDCIPPHIDNPQFLRPFCTLSLKSVCPIVFGAKIAVVRPGEFQGDYSLPLPLGSVLVIKGNGADVAKHTIPAVPTDRVSITFRKMDPKFLTVARRVPFRGDEDWKRPGPAAAGPAAPATPAPPPPPPSAASQSPGDWPSLGGGGAGGGGQRSGALSTSSYGARGGSAAGGGGRGNANSNGGGGGVGNGNGNGNGNRRAPPPQDDDPLPVNPKAEALRAAFESGGGGGGSRGGGGSSRGGGGGWGSGGGGGQWRRGGE